MKEEDPRIKRILDHYKAVSLHFPANCINQVSVNQKLWPVKSSIYDYANYIPKKNQNCNIRIMAR